MDNPPSQPAPPVNEPAPPSPPAADPTRRAIARAVGLCTFVIGVAAMKLAADILIPVALAVLITFLLHPLVGWLARRGRVPRPAAVVATLVLAGSVVLGMGWLVVSQATDLTERLPDYRDNLRTKVRSLKQASGGENGTLERISGTIKDLKEELAATRPATRPSTRPGATQPAVIAGATLPPNIPPVVLAPEPSDRPPETTAAAPDDTPEPLPVRIVEEENDAVSTLAALAPPLLTPIAEAGIVALLVTFLLMYSDDVRDRLIWLAGKRQVSLTTAALDEIGTRIGGFLRMSLVVNVCYGTMVGLGLTLLGVPNAVLWGVLGVFLRFVPFVGPWIAAALPSLLALAVFPGWTQPLGVVAMFVVVELITNLILEPWLWGGSSGISTLGVVVAAVFWSWLWGPLGLLLAVPISVCLVVIGKHVPQLSVFYHMFGRDRAIPASGRLYQRLLVGDEVSARQILGQEMSTRSLVETCDAVLLPVLNDLKRDQSAGAVDLWQVRGALRVLERVIVDVEPDLAPHPDTPVERPPADRPSRGTLLIASTQGDVDDFAAGLLARCAESMGIAAEVTSSHRLASEVGQRLLELRPSVAVVVQVAPISWGHSRHVLKALLRAAPEPAWTASRLIDLAAQPHEPASDRTAQRLGSRRALATDERTPLTADQLGIRREIAFAPTLQRVCELTQVCAAPTPNTPTPQTPAAGLLAATPTATL